LSTLSIRFKRRARIVAAGLTLSAAALAIIPGVAEAEGNLAAESIGTVQGVSTAPEANTQAALLDSTNNATYPQGGGTDYAAPADNTADQSMGTVQGANADPQLDT
jgi:hypothetical protein